MEMTTYDMERPAMPMAAPVGAVVPGTRLAVDTDPRPHVAPFAPPPAVQPGITGNDPQAIRFGLTMAGRSTRRLGSGST